MIPKMTVHHGQDTSPLGVLSFCTVLHSREEGRDSALENTRNRQRTRCLTCKIRREGGPEISGKRPRVGGSGERSYGSSEQKKMPFALLIWIHFFVSRTADSVSTWGQHGCATMFPMDGRYGQGGKVSWEIGVEADRYGHPNRNKTRSEPRLRLGNDVPHRTKISTQTESKKLIMDHDRRCKNCDWRQQSTPHFQENYLR